MKKISIVFGIFAVVALSSCIKTRTCECITYVDGEEQPKIDNTFLIDDLTKQGAIEECNESDTTETSVAGVVTSTNCELIKE